MFELPNCFYTGDSISIYAPADYLRNPLGEGVVWKKNKHKLTIAVDRRQNFSETQKLTVAVGINSITYDR